MWLVLRSPPALAQQQQQFPSQARLACLLVSYSASYTSFLCYAIGFRAEYPLAKKVEANLRTSSTCFGGDANPRGARPRATRPPLTRRGTHKHQQAPARHPRSPTGGSWRFPLLLRYARKRFHTNVAPSGLSLSRCPSSTLNKQRASFNSMESSHPETAQASVFLTLSRASPNRKTSP